MPSVPKRVSRCKKYLSSFGFSVTGKYKKSRKSRSKSRSRKSRSKSRSRKSRSKSRSRKSRSKSRSRKSRSKSRSRKSRSKSRSRKYYVEHFDFGRDLRDFEREMIDGFVDVKSIDLKTHEKILLNEIKRRRLKDRNLSKAGFVDELFNYISGKLFTISGSPFLSKEEAKKRQRELLKSPRIYKIISKLPDRIEKERFYVGGSNRTKLREFVDEIFN